MKQEKEIKKTSNIGLIYCRKCQKNLEETSFYNSYDGGMWDSNKKLSICKKCIQEKYEEFYKETDSIEKSIHRLCVSINIKYSNNACDALKTQIQTMLKNGKKVNSVFGIYLSKLISTIKSMNKDITGYMGYEDMGTIYVSEAINTKEIPIPEDVHVFWGKDIKKKEDIEFLEEQYANFKQTHSTESYAEIVLLKQVCYTMLDIKTKRNNNDDTIKLVKELQDLMRNLAISPNASMASSQNKGEEAFGLWIEDIERYEPAEWLKSDPRGDIYRDVADTEEYFQKYFVRPAKNFIMGSKDFNIAEEDSGDDNILLTDEDTPDYKDIDDGVLEEG